MAETSRSIKKLKQLKRSEPPKNETVTIPKRPRMEQHLARKNVKGGGGILNEKKRKIHEASQKRLSQKIRQRCLKYIYMGNLHDIHLCNKKLC